jgi:hypothetical protein
VVSDAGSAAHDATIPAAHPAHSPTDAVVRTAALVPARAAASVGPTVKGSATHKPRTTQATRRSTDAARTPAGERVR